MGRNILEYLETAAERFPERLCYADEKMTFTFSEARAAAHAIGTRVAGSCREGKPVAVMMEKGAAMAVALLGAAAGGCPYCPIDVTMPRERMEIIFSVLRPAAVIAGREQEKLAGEVLRRFSEKLSGQKDAAASYMAVSGQEDAAAGSATVSRPEDIAAVPVFQFEELAAGEADEALLSGIREKITAADPLYILFTSGSTGIPKGVVGNHRMILNNLEWLASRYPLAPDDVLGNQVPLYFVVANHDLYCPLRFGCSSFFIPAGCFSFPAKLVQLLNERRVTAVFWVPFALEMAANLRTLEEQAPRYLKYVFFVGEVMPVRQLNYWRRYVPEAKYINLYGSTETHMCCFYEVDRDFSETETLPLGGPCGDVGFLVLDEKGQEVLPENEKTGELCIRGCAVGDGYYHNPEKTAKRYVKNPLRPESGEIIYRTGDLVRYAPDGLLKYCGRMDYQIKHLGYRIELGEIEAAAGRIPGLKSCACVYHAARQLILFFYDGVQKERKVLSGALSERLPRYMLPNRYIYLEELPRNASGKIDRRRLEEEYAR